jgi:6-phosphogluconolactonase/glucosamine-6-phosphate isomerase/deaminase
MELKTCLDEYKWVSAVNAWLANRVDRFSAQRVFVPAGNTPLPLYKSWEDHHPEFARPLTFVQVDEVLGAAPIFRTFFERFLPSYIGQLEFIVDGDGVADLGVLGLGTNGHVAFHEPGLDLGLYSACVPLEESTASRLGVPLGSWGLTYGVGAFMKTKALALLVRGDSKREVLQRALGGDPSLPASALLKHPDLTVFLDFELSV